MNIFLPALMLACMCALAGYAQPDKQLKAEIAKLSPEAYQKMRRDDAALEEDITAKNAQIIQRKADIANNQNTVQKKDEAILLLEEQLRKLKAQVGEVNGTRQGRKQLDCGFGVQIGAYKNPDLAQYLESHPNFMVETDQSGVKKYVMGYFTSYWEAKSLSKYLIKQGAQAYVVGFYQNKRVPDLKDMTQCTF